MKIKANVLILHGIGGYAGIHWQKWLKEELEKKGYNILMPTLPNSDRPDRKKWKSIVKQIIAQVELKNLSIVGHSLSIPTALDVIEELNKTIKALFCVSGFCSDYGVELNSYFLKEKNIDFNKVRKNVKKSIVFYADNDPYVPQEKLYELSNNLLTEPIIIHNGGHLNTDAGFTTFPQLLEEIVNV